MILRNLRNPGLDIEEGIYPGGQSLVAPLHSGFSCSHRKFQPLPRTPPLHQKHSSGTFFLAFSPLFSLSFFLLISALFCLCRKLVFKSELLQIGRSVVSSHKVQYDNENHSSYYQIVRIPFRKIVFFPPDSYVKKKTLEIIFIYALFRKRMFSLEFSLSFFAE